MKYFALFGLGGSFGGLQNCHVIEVNSQEEAEDYAYLEACEIYESYDGLHGIRSVEDIMEEEGLDEEEAYEEWKDERETWLDYKAEPLDQSKVEEYKGLHYQDMTI